MKSAHSSKTSGSKSESQFNNTFFDSKIFDDMAKLVGSTAGIGVSLKHEIENRIKTQIESFLRQANLVTRDEFEAVKEMASKARMGQESAEKRIQALERKLNSRAGKSSVKPIRKNGKKTTAEKQAKKQ